MDNLEFYDIIVVHVPGVVVTGVLVPLEYIVIFYTIHTVSICCVTHCISVFSLIYHIFIVYTIMTFLQNVLFSAKLCHICVPFIFILDCFVQVCNKNV